MKHTEERQDDAFGRRMGFLTGLLSCRHRHMSRPFTSSDHESYVVCLDCGARRHFDPIAFVTFGGFYFPPTVNIKSQ